MDPPLVEEEAPHLNASLGGNINHGHKSWTRQSQEIYASGLHLLGDNTSIINKNAEAVIDASKEAGLEVNTEETTYMLMSCYYNAGQNRNTEMFSDAVQ
jgi:hypothetical protein